MRWNVENLKCDNEYYTIKGKNKNQLTTDVSDSSDFDTGKENADRAFSSNKAGSIGEGKVISYTMYIKINF